MSDFTDAALSRRTDWHGAAFFLNQVDARGFAACGYAGMQGEGYYRCVSRPKPAWTFISTTLPVSRL